MTEDILYESYREIDDLPVSTKLVLPPENIVRKGIMQFHHGMMEYKERYLFAMDYFSKRGYICCIHDMRGHGQNIDNENIAGYIGENGGDLLVEDMHSVTIFLKNNFPDLPLVIIGHSMGSLVARAYLKKYAYEADRVFLMGSPSNGKEKYIGLILTEFFNIFLSDKDESQFINNYFYGMLEKRFKKLNPEFKGDYSRYSWVSNDEKVVKSFLNDQKSNFYFTLNGYYTLFKLLFTVYSGSKKRWVGKNNKVKISFLWGSEDVITFGKENLLKSVNDLKNKGYKNTDFIEFENMSHNLFDENKNDLVFNYIIKEVEKL